MTLADALIASTLPIGYFAVDLIRAWWGLDR